MSSFSTHNGDTGLDFVLNGANRNKYLVVVKIYSINKIPMRNAFEKRTIVKIGDQITIALYMLV